MRSIKNIKYTISDWWDLWKNIIGLFALLIVLAGMIYLTVIPNPWKRKQNEKLIYRNETCILVGTNEGDGFTNDKFHKPIVIKKWLIRRTVDTTQYAELTNITNEEWYSHKIGDTLHYDYILKRRFFTINK